MSQRFLPLLFLCLFSFILTAIKLPDPKKYGGIPIFEAAAKRQSQRDFTDESIKEEEMSQLLWAAYGFNDVGHRSVPSSKGFHPLDLYLFTKDGIYQYLPDTHEIELKISGDHRDASGTDDYVTKAALNICFIGNYSRAKYASREISEDAFRIDVGYACENMYLTCAGEGLKCVVRANIDSTKILETLKLTTDEAFPTMCFSAGR